MQAMTYQVKVISGGKIVIPADLRREFGIKDGDSLVVERDPAGGMTVKTYSQVVLEVQRDIAAMSKPYAGSVVEDLLAERRAEAAQEWAEHRDWLAQRTA